MTCIVTSEQYFKAVDEMSHILLNHELNCDLGHDSYMSEETEQRLLELEHIIQVYEEQNAGMLEVDDESK